MPVIIKSPGIGVKLPKREGDSFSPLALGLSVSIDYRNSVVIATTPNDGQYNDSTGDTGQAQYVYRVCEAGTGTCSNDVTVIFPR